MAEEANIKHIERRKVTDQVIEQIVSLINKQVWKPGERLPPEFELMKKFGVGRSTLREAIGALAIVGLIKVSPGSGTFVAKSAEEFLAKPISWGVMSTSHGVDELFEARLAIEVAAVGLATKNANMEDIDRLRQFMHDLQSSKKNNVKRIQADMAFHYAIAEISKNKLLSRFLSECNRMIRIWMEQIAFIVPYDTVVAHHEQIMRAIEERDIHQAQKAMSCHLEWAGTNFAKSISNKIRKKLD